MPASAATHPRPGEKPQARRQNPHVGRHALQHHPGNRQSRHRRGVRAAAASSCIRALAAFSVQQTIDFFEAEGVATKVEETGKIFPVSNKAADVLDALLRRLERSGAVLALAEPVSMKRAKRALLLTTSRANARRREGHADNRRPIVSRVRHDRRRLSLCRAVRPSHRAAASCPGAVDDQHVLGRRACAASLCPMCRCAFLNRASRWTCGAVLCCSPTSACRAR